MPLKYCPGQNAMKEQDCASGKKVQGVIHFQYMKTKGMGLYMYTGLVNSVCYNVAISLRCMRGAGAQALACRIAEAHSWSNRQHAVLELDIMLHDNVNMPEVRPEKVAGECLASSGAHGGLNAISQAAASICTDKPSL